MQGPNPEVFIHDSAGNLLADSPATPQGQQATGNRLNLFGDAHFSYDAYGNRSQQARGKQGALKTLYQYNALNQLTAIAVNGVITQYTYDPLGRRISKRSANKSCEFLWLGDQLLAEQSLDATGAQLSANTYLFISNSFEPIAFVQNDGIYYYHLDHLGTPQEITNQNGELVWAVSYKAYGNLAVAFKAEVENNLRFAGQYFDEESGLHYNRFRYYDPACGRFINQDPIGLLGGVNNYQYVANPLRFVDPFGLTPKDCGAARGGVKSQSEFDAEYGHKFSSKTELDAAWKVYQENSGSKEELVIGRLKDTEAGEALGVRRLNNPNWTVNVNDAWIQGGIDAKKHFYLGSESSVAHLRAQAWPHHPQYPYTVKYRELKQLNAVGYTRSGDYLMPPK